MSYSGFGPMPVCAKCDKIHTPALCRTCHAIHPVVCPEPKTKRVPRVGQRIGR